MQLANRHPTGHIGPAMLATDSWKSQLSGSILSTKTVVAVTNELLNQLILAYGPILVVAAHLALQIVLVVLRMAMLLRSIFLFL